MTQIILTSGTSWTVPGDFNKNDNTVEAIGGGANGNRNGGGGAEYRKLTNFDPAGAGSIPYTIGGAGADTTWNTTSLIAKKGNGQSGGTGGTGGTGHDGGGGGGGYAGGGGGGGGGAGGTTAAGSGGTSAPFVAGGPGGNGGTSNGGAGGAAGINISNPGSAGGNGTIWSATQGAGGGGGGAAYGGNGGNGGNYGGGGGGGGGQGGGEGAGQQGVIVITYAPIISISVSDSLAGSDVVAILAALPVVDSLASADTPTIVASVPIADTGALDDVPSVVQQQFLTDALQLSADDVVVIIGPQIADVLSGNDVLSDLLVTLPPITDALAGDDVVDILNAFAVDDSISLVDALNSLLVGVPIAENLGLTDDLGVRVSLGLADSLTAVDIASIHHVFSLLPVRSTIHPALKFYLVRRNKTLRPGLQLYTRQELGNVGTVVVSDRQKLITTLTDRASDAPV